MDNEENVYLTDDERGHFQTWESLFASDGWMLFTTELQEELDDLPSRGFSQAASWDEVLAGRAAETKMRELLSYPDIIEQRKQNIIQERELEADEAGRYDPPPI